MGDNWPGFHTRESIATNDCYASFKYTHQFVTNYDFDEFILPRRFTPTQNLPAIANQLSCPIQDSAQSGNFTAVLAERYSLYDYVTDLIKRQTKKIAWLNFEHMLFFDQIPNEFFVQLDTALNSKSDKFLKLNYSNMIMQFKYEPSKDSQLAKSVLGANKAIKCLNSSSSSKNKLIDPKFNRIYTIWCSARRGKSVFNTDYVDFVNQHFGEQVTDKDAVEVRLPVDEGFVNHYRVPIDDQFFGLTWPFTQHFRVDLESFGFINSLLKDGVFD